MFSVFVSLNLLPPPPLLPPFIYSIFIIYLLCVCCNIKHILSLCVIIICVVLYFKSLWWTWSVGNCMEKCWGCCCLNTNTNMPPLNPHKRHHQCWPHFYFFYVICWAFWDLFAHKFMVLFLYFISKRRFYFE